MLKQIKPLNVTYIPIMDNYPQFDNVSEVPFKGEFCKKVSGTMEKGYSHQLFIVHCTYIYKLMFSILYLSEALPRSKIQHEQGSFL